MNSGNSGKKRLLGYGALLLTALIWGFAFIAQHYVGSIMGVFAINGMRYYFATISLGIVVIFYVLYCKKTGKKIAFSKDTILWGVLAGIALFTGNNSQQWGINMTSVANAGFITTLYIVFVPIFELLMRRRPPKNTLIALPVAITGFSLISMGDTISVAFGDLVLLINAMVFAMQIICIGMGVKKSDPIILTFVQFVTAAMLSIPAMSIEGFPTVQELQASILFVLYIGIISTAVGFCLQTIGQKVTEMSIATFIMSLESVFALILATLIIKEQHSSKELLGCLFAFIAVYIAQLDLRPRLLTYNRSKYFVN